MIADFSALTPMQWTILLVSIALCFSVSAWAILDVWKRTYESPMEKSLWMQICIFIPIIGALSYLFLGKQRGRL
ncbi:MULTISPECIES: PLD nuclease N-terminal domain-containing protein [unclassified Pseudodesulfovibrio]|uniref:PLD nuclease N-terminal domain-containing protein n=1 Tax=unclassified Pseudodesulfovibrio TaxID=2661612 RepID=UPI000FEC19A4|nr:MULTISPECIES: PLD nuclease N-terminal domain-containing protein [unclassified Pseudodesulfovibrio]MCJ2163777.1 PLD nuclease N-terminal domain-containing protein [Pseudodesulfovibrio sp. S3-i]RWU05974.1 PLDc_N domain-containing protein [Pseudodesulfovibrio sp. S3]